MEPVSLWAAVEFTACNGSTEALLTAAARAGLHPYGVTALPGGFGGRCAAWQYPRLAALARKHRVRLRIRRKLGLYFRLRPLLRRAGLWAGLTVFVPLLLFAQQFVWYADTSSLTTGQAARACAVLREAGLQPGAAVTEAKLTAGEYALLHSGEFSWASLNFAKGRLVVEAAAAKGIRDKVKIMIGGAPVTQSFCDSIGADCYTADAASAADEALKFCVA